MEIFGRTRLLGFALLVATFVAGALSGAALERVLGAEEPGDASAPESRQERSYVIDGIDMSAEQRATIDSILDGRAERMRTVWREVEPRMDAITDSTRTDIMDVLTSAQREAYERALDERRQERLKRRDGEGG